MASWATDDPSTGAVDQLEAARRAGIPIATHGVSTGDDGITREWGPEDVAKNIGKDPRDLNDSHKTKDKKARGA